MRSFSFILYASTDASNVAEEKTDYVKAIANCAGNKTDPSPDQTSMKIKADVVQAADTFFLVSTKLKVSSQFLNDRPLVQTIIKGMIYRGSWEEKSNMPVIVMRPFKRAFAEAD